MAGKGRARGRGGGGGGRQGGYCSVLQYSTEVRKEYMHLPLKYDSVGSF